MRAWISWTLNFLWNLRRSDDPEAPMKPGLRAASPAALTSRYPSR
jgi:hypothetical protein